MEVFVDWLFVNVGFIISDQTILVMAVPRQGAFCQWNESRKNLALRNLIPNNRYAFRGGIRHPKLYQTRVISLKLTSGESMRRKLINELPVLTA